MSAFEPFPKLARFNRQVTVTEKIDGTNAQVLILPHADACELEVDERAKAIYQGDFWVFAGSRKRLITRDDDNAGFARWVADYAAQLVAFLGHGRHFGEWWGQGIQRNYGLDHKRFSLFNSNRWSPEDLVGCGIATLDVVPQLGIWTPSADASYHATTEWPEIVNNALLDLYYEGSKAAPGFMNPEGVVVYHSASRTSYKITLDADGKPKGSNE